MICTCFSSARALVVLATLALAIQAAPARSEEVIFPPGSRVGLVPPPGMVPSKTFDGFADPAKDAAILIAVLPADAFAQIEKVLETDALKKQGVTVDKREPVQLAFGKGILLVGRQVADKTHFKKWLLVAAASDLTAMVTVQVPDPDDVYSDRALRTALATLAVRAKVPEEEELGLLPFSVGDLAGFRVDDVLRGRALMLRDAPAAADGDKETSKETGKETNKETSKETTAHGFDARMLIAAVPGGPSEADQRADFARLMFNEIGGIRQVRITMSEPLRIGGQYGFQTMAEAQDVRTGADVRVIQWLRFGGGGYLQMVGIGGADGWTTVLGRLRTIRDSVELK
jgi:hypothetical protein